MEDGISEIIDKFSYEKFEWNNNAVLECIVDIGKHYQKNSRHKYYLISQYLRTVKNENSYQMNDSISYYLVNIRYTISFMEQQNQITQNKLDEDINIPKKLVDMEKISVCKIIEKLNKLYDHISLEEERYVQNSEMINKSVLNESELLAQKLNNSIEAFSEKVVKIESNLNVNIITIIGIFSAIIFVFFGGLTGLATVASGVVGMKNREDLYIPMLVIMTLGLIIFDIVFLLIYSIAKMVDKNIGRHVSTGRYPNIYGMEEVEEEEQKYYIVKRILSYGYSEEKGTRCKNKFFARCLRKSRCMWEEIKCFIINMSKILLLRYPHVAITNVALIISIIIIWNVK